MPDVTYETKGAEPKLRDPEAPQKARGFIDGLGGPANIVKVEEAAETRLRVVVRQVSDVDEAALKAAGVAGTVAAGEKVLHLIVGLNADQYAAEMRGQLAGTLTRV
jgi:PTS system glucose-specific IIC component